MCLYTRLCVYTVNMILVTLSIRMNCRLLIQVETNSCLKLLQLGLQYYKIITIIMSYNNP